MVTDRQVKQAKNDWAMHQISDQMAKAEENKKAAIAKKKKAIKKALDKKHEKFLNVSSAMKKSLKSTVTYRKGRSKIGVKRFEDMLNRPF